MTAPWAITAGVLMHAATIAAAETTSLSIQEPFKGQGSFVDWAEWTTAALAILSVNLPARATRASTWEYPNGIIPSISRLEGVYRAQNRRRDSQPITGYSVAKT